MKKRRRGLLGSGQLLRLGWGLSIGLTACASAGDAVVTFAQATRESTEIGAPTIDFAVNRSGNVSGVTVISASTRDGDGLPGYGVPGISETNYKAFAAKQFTFAPGDATVKIPLTLLQTDLGDVDVDMYVDLAVVSGAETGSIMTTRVTIRGSHGWLPYTSADTGLPELDVYNPPAVMPTMTAQQLTSMNAVISGKRIDATGFNSALNAMGLSSVLIENCDMYNADWSMIELINCGIIKVRNNRIRFSNRSGGSWGNRGSALWVWCSSSEHKVSSCQFLNNFVELCSGAFITPGLYPSDSNSVVEVMYNFYKDVAPRTNSAANSQLAALQGGGSYPHTYVEGNIFLQTHRNDGVTYGSREDVVNTYRVDGYSAADPLRVTANIFVGANGPGLSGFGVLLSDHSSYNGKHYKVTLNTISCISNGGISGYRASHANIYGNWLYNGVPDGTYYEDLAGSRNAVGLTIGTAGSNYVGLNQIRWWRTRDEAIQRSDRWYPDSSTVTGDSSNMTIPEWDDPDVGDRRFRKMRLALNQEAFDTGIEWLYFAHDFPLGDAKVHYVAATKTLTLAAHGEGAGAAVDFDVPQWEDAANGYAVPAWYVYSSGGAWGLVRLRNGGANLPGSDRTYTVKVSRFTPQDRAPYVGPTGKWRGKPGAGAIRLGGPEDDAEERLDTGVVNMNSTDLELVRDATNQLVGLRFPDVDVPAGALMTAAYLTFVCDETDSEPTALRVHAEAADDAGPFLASAGNLSGRPQTIAFADWAPAAWNAVGQAHQSPDLSAVIQEIIDRPGWQKNNAVVLLLSGSGKRTAVSCNGDPDLAPTLTVSYRLDAFEAYNDLAWLAGQTTKNITILTRDQSGALRDYASGASCLVTLSVNHGGTGPLGGGADAQPGTDARDVFGGIVDCAGMIGYSTNDLTVTFSGLEQEFEYEVALFGNRDNTDYTNRLTRCTISDVDAFRNTSSTGSFFSGASDPSAVVINGANTVNGHVARFSGIKPGTNGTFTVTVWDDDSSDAPKFYINALKLCAAEPSGSQRLVARRTTWKYEASGTDLGTAWRDTAYADADWPEAHGPFGYQAPGLTTWLPYGPDPNDKHMTTYLRRHFFLADTPAPNMRMLLHARYDDGFVAYLNGQEITRQSMPPGTILYDTAAENHTADAYETIDLTAHLGKLVAGQNVLAVEVHQRAPNSSDLVIDTELVLRATEGPIDRTVLQRGATWRFRRGSVEASTPAVAWREPDFDSSGWESGPAPFGYSTNPDAGPFGTPLDTMRYLYSSVFLLGEFVLEQPLRIGKLALDATYDDGFILWINAQEVARPNMSGTPGSFVACDAPAPCLATIEPTEWSLALEGGQLPVLQRTNVIAVQVFNAGLTSSDLVFDMALTATFHALAVADDSDADGMPDTWELTWLGGPAETAEGDKDNDGVSNLAEYIAGTDPDDANEYPAVRAQLNAGQLEVLFDTRTASEPGLTRHYILEQRDAMADDVPWHTVVGCEDVVGAGQTETHTPAAGAQERLFRARTWLTW